MPAERPTSSDPSPASVWALSGVIALFLTAVFRLGRQGLEAMASGLSPVQWLAFVALTGVFLYVEGVRALQRRYAPFVVSRARDLRDEESGILRLLAPLYAMSLVGAPARSLVRSWAGVAAVVLAVVVVRSFPAPWRGMVDFAVAAALLWGAGSIVAEGRRAG